MAEQDPQLDLKKRARRRLVGAAALALLAAIVLPLIMDQEPKPVGQDIQIRIPSQNAPGAPLLADKPSSSAAAPAPVSAPLEPAPAPATGAAPAPATPAAAVSVPMPTPAPVAAPAKTEEKPKPVAKAEADSKLAAKATTPSAPADQARAEAILNGAEASSQPAAPGQYVVQLGVFGDAGNVKKLRERIKGQGYNSFTEDIKTDKGVKMRVRAGPFPTREAAAKARDSLRHHTGIDGIVADK